MARGKFIVFEGIDGSGKSTQFVEAVKYLLQVDEARPETKYRQVYGTREPTYRSQEIRKRLNSATNVKADADWFTQAFIEDRRLHADLDIIPALGRAIHVISDRYDLSTYAYQQTQGVPFKRIHELHNGILVPDATFFYDVPGEVAFARRKNAGATSSFDKDLKFQKELRTIYLKLPSLLPERNIIIIDGNRPIEAVFEDTKKELETILNN